MVTHILSPPEAHPLQLLPWLLGCLHLSIIDARTGMLPLRPLLGWGCTSLAASTLAAAIGRSGAAGGAAAQVLLVAGSSGITAFVFFFALALLAPGSLGGGDVKLAGYIGLFLGTQGGIWLTVLGILTGTLLGAAAALTLLLGNRIRARASPEARTPAARQTSTASFAYGPWLLLGGAAAATLQLLG